MNQTFFVLKNGENLGPFTREELVREVETGRFTLSDVAGATGTSDLHRIENLLNSAPSQETSLSSTVPKAPHQNTSAACDSVLIHQIWNPWIISALSTILGILFGSVLVALNWHLIGKHGRALLTWALGLLAVYVQATAGDYYPGTIPYILGFLFWFPLLALPQIVYLRTLTSNHSIKRPILVPAGIGFAANVIFLIPWGSPGTNIKLPQTTASESTKTYTPEELSKQAQFYVVEIHTRWQEPYLYFFQKSKGCDGSAVLIEWKPGKCLFVTNRHVVDVPVNATNIIRTFSNPDLDKPLEIEVLAYAKAGLDLALLRFQSEQVKGTMQPATRAVQTLAVGEPCIAIGNALGQGTSVTSGVISKIDAFRDITVIRTSAPISPGNSGGGLFSLKGGALIGITTSSNIDVNAQNINYAIPTNYFMQDDIWEPLQP